MAELPMLKSILKNSGRDGYLDGSSAPGTASTSGSDDGVQRVHFPDFRGRVDRAFAGLPGVGAPAGLASVSTGWVLGDVSTARKGDPTAGDSSDEEAEACAEQDRGNDESKCVNTVGQTHEQLVFPVLLGQAFGPRRVLFNSFVYLHIPYCCPLRRWEEDLDCLDSDDEATEEQKCEKMRRIIGKCHVLDKEEELDDNDCMAMGMSAPRHGLQRCLALPSIPSRVPHNLAATLHLPLQSPSLLSLSSGSCDAEPDGGKLLKRWLDGRARGRYRQINRSARRECVGEALPPAGYAPQSQKPAGRRSQGRQGASKTRVPVPTVYNKNITSFYGSCCANNSKGALNTPETLYLQ
eukprot:570922-Prorocentrum_minimum.AAC.1